MEKCKKASVVMLPNIERNLPEYRWGEYKITNYNGRLDFKQYVHTTGDDVFQHLYFINDDEINDGEICMCFHKETGAPLLDRYDIGDAHCYKYKPNKIVASTDTSLGLPTIPESFIKHYVSTNGAISDVLLEIWTKETLIGLLDDTYIGKLRTADCEVIVDYEQIALQAVDGIKALNPSCK